MRQQLKFTEDLLMIVTYMPDCLLHLKLYIFSKDSERKSLKMPGELHEGIIGPNCP